MLSEHDQDLTFKASDETSVGIELELQLIDPVTLDLVDGIKPLLELFPDSPYFKPEFIQNTIEIASPVCHSLTQAHDSMKCLARELKAKCRELGMTLCGAGTHAFGRRLALITPQPRFQHMEEVAGVLSHTQITFATHVHIGMNSGDEAISLMRDLKAYLPLLIALSASSPFWRGYDTGYASYRHRILAASRSYGIPPTFSDWQDFVRFYHACQRASVFASINDIHWDIRPRPCLGTLEIRVMDAQPTIAATIALAGFVRALVFYLRHTPAHERPASLPQPLSWWIEKENHFQASRYGLEANFISDERGTARRLNDVAGEVCRTLRPDAAALDQSAWLEQLQENMQQGLCYAHQRRICRQASDDVAQIVAALTAMLERELAG